MKFKTGNCFLMAALYMCIAIVFGILEYEWIHYMTAGLVFAALPVVFD